MADIVGARNYLREGEHALFQKRKRDHNVIGLFDGSSDVNLYVICGMLPGVLSRPLRDAAPLAVDLFDATREAPPFEGRGLKSLSWGLDVIVQRFLSAELRAALPLLDARSGSDLVDMHRVLEQRLLDVRAEFERVAGASGGWGSMSYQAHECAKRYASVLAGLCCFQYWCFNHELAGFANAAVLKTILGHWFGVSAWIDNGPVLELALSQLDLHQLFSFRPVTLEDARD